jgi:ABC-2 type transport system ATP-binding protein
MIQVDKLTKVYGDFTAIDGVSFRLEKGDVLGFLGPNGAGKTTTMRILTCYTPATKGQASVAGFDVRAQSMEVRKRIGYLPENIPLYDEMTVYSYLRFMAEAKGHRGKKVRQAADQAIEECGLGDVAKRLIGHVSRGYRQRVGLAQAVLGDPEVLVLDEPTIGLDPRQIVEIRNLIKNMAGRRTVILSSHILPEVSMTCQKVLIIDRGKIVASGTPEEMVADLSDAHKTEITAIGPSADIAGALRAVPGVRAVEITREAKDGGTGDYLVSFDAARDPRADMAIAITGAGYGLLEMRTRGLSLEDVFIRIVAGEESKHAA